MVSLCIIPLVILGNGTYTVSKEKLEEKLTLASTQTLSQINEGLQEYFNGITQIISISADNDHFVNINEGDNAAYIEGLLKNVKDNNQDVLSVYYGLATKDIIMYPESDLPDDFDPTSRDWYQQAVNEQGGVILTTPYEDASTGSNVITIAKAVVNNDKVVGVVALDCSLSTLTEKIAQKEVGNSGYVFLSDGEGKIISHPNTELINTDTAAKLPFWQQTKENEEGFVNYQYDGENRFGAFQTNSMSSEVTAAIEEVANAIDDVSRGAVAQAEDARDGANGMETLAKELDEISDNSVEMDTISNETRDLGSKGLEMVDTLREKSSRAKESTDEVNAIIEDMYENSLQISNISDALTAITSQTNLLSLNASIEAARAGTAGQGFAVVASEIRSLAEQSKVSTEEIKKIIENIQSKAAKAAESIKDTKQAVGEQDVAVVETQEIFNHILEAIKEMSVKVKEIRSAILNTNENKESLLTAIENISSVSQETAASSQEVTASTEEINATMEEFSRHSGELKTVAEQLEIEVGRFKISS